MEERDMWKRDTFLVKLPRQSFLHVQVSILPIATTDKHSIVNEWSVLVTFFARKAAPHPPHIHPMSRYITAHDKFSKPSSTASNEHWGVKVWVRC